MQTDEKLTLILTKVSLGESRFARIEQNLDSVVQGQKRLKTFENVLKSYEDRIKLLEYKSIDIEARARRNNLLFYGFGEERNENCREKIGRLLCDKFNIQPENIVIERAYRIGKFRNNALSPRPIIAAFRDYILTETIMSQGSNLKNSPHSVSRDYPLEITNARKLLWDELKQIKSQNPSAKVSVGYPAKLIMNNQVCFDLFPEWDSIVRGSRIDSKHPSQQRRSKTGSVDNVVTSQASNSNIINGSHVTSRQMSTSSNMQQTHNFSQDSPMPPPPPPPQPPSTFPRKANQYLVTDKSATPTQSKQTKKPNWAAVTSSQDEAANNSSLCVSRGPETVSREMMMDFRNSDSELTEPSAETISKPSQPTTTKNKARGGLLVLEGRVPAGPYLEPVRNPTVLLPSKQTDRQSQNESIQTVITLVVP